MFQFLTANEIAFCLESKLMSVILFMWAWTNFYPTVASHQAISLVVYNLDLFIYGTSSFCHSSRFLSRREDIEYFYPFKLETFLNIIHFPALLIPLLIKLIYLHLSPSLV